jgi:hypothetical protein
MGPPFRTSQFSYLETDRSRKKPIFCGTTFLRFSKNNPILTRVSPPQALATVKKKLEESLTIRDEDIKEVVRNLKSELNHADPKIRKRVIQTLFEEIKIHPKEGNPWSRMLEISGAYIPLTRLKMASPTRFELVLPT